MCKLLILTNTEQLQRTGRLTETISHAAELVGRTELDGFGYALGDKVTGQAVIERSLAVGREYEPLINFGTDGTISVRSLPNEVPFLTPRESAEALTDGLTRITAGPLIMHGRTSTNMDGLINTHPMVVKDTVLCHNGVVTYKGPKYRKRTGNDSEDLTFAFRKFGIKGAAKRLTGYYAFGAISTKDKTLTVVRDSIAELHGAWFSGLQSWCFGTSAEHVRSLAKFLGESLHKSDVRSFVKDYSVTFSFDGALLKTEEFFSRGYSAREASKASKSLGRTLTVATNGSEKRGQHAVDSWDDWKLYESVNDASSAIVSEEYGAEEPAWLDFTAEDIRAYLIENQDDNRIKFWHYEHGAQSEGKMISWDEFTELTDAEQAECVIETVAGNYIDCTPLAVG